VTPDVRAVEQRFAVIRVYAAAGDVIETHEHMGEVQRVVGTSRIMSPVSCFARDDCNAELEKEISVTSYEDSSDDS
jgi:hypothetical protein